jgi:hypothetical protein
MRRTGSNGQFEVLRAGNIVAVIPGVPPMAAFGATTPTRRKYRLFAAPTGSVSRTIRCVDQSPRDRVNVPEGFYAPHVLHFVPACMKDSDR